MYISQNETFPFKIQNYVSNIFTKIGGSVKYYMLGVDIFPTVSAVQ